MASFLLESYGSLRSDPSETTNFYLSIISEQLANSGSPTVQNITTLIAPPPSFTPLPSSVRINVLWTLSLVFSLVSALVATLVQSWLSRYTRLVSQPRSPSETAARRAFYFDGIKKFKFPVLAEALPTVLHAALFLFFAGLVEFVLPLNKEVAKATAVVVALSAALYVFFTIFPLISSKSPYRTPLASILLTAHRACAQVVVAHWIRFLKFLQNIINTHQLSDKLSWDMLHHQLRCEEKLKGLVALGRRVQTTPKTVAASLRWFISQLSTDDEHDTFVHALLPILNDVHSGGGKGESGHSNQWIRTFLGGEKPLLPLEHLRRHLPVLLHSSISFVAKSTSSDFPVHEERLEICQKCLLKCIQEDTVLSADVHIIDALRRHIPSRPRSSDARTTSLAHVHATISLLTVLSDALNRGVRYRAYGRPEVCIPQGWSVDQLLAWVDKQESAMPILLDVAAACVLPRADASTSMTRLNKLVASRTPGEDTVDIVVATSNTTDTASSITISQHAFLEWLCIHTLNCFLSVVRRDANTVRNSPVLKAMITTASYGIMLADQRGESFDVKTQETFLDHIEAIYGEARLNGRSAIAPVGPNGTDTLFTQDATKHFCKIASSLPDSACRQRGEQLLGHFERLHLHI